MLKTVRERVLRRVLWRLEEIFFRNVPAMLASMSSFQSERLMRLIMESEFEAGRKEAMEDLELSKAYRRRG